MDAYLVHIGVLAAIFVLASLSFGLAAGYTGLVNFGHPGLMAVGAYASAILVRNEGWPFWAGVLCAGALSMLLAAALTATTKNIKGDYYAVVTLGFMFVVYAAAVNFEGLTRGTLGLPGIPRPDFAAANTEFLFLSVAITVAAHLFLDRLTKSPFGRALEAVRDDEEVAEALGKPVFKLKMIVMTISGFWVGISGALLAHYVQFLGPSSIWLPTLVWVLAAQIVGGLGSMAGAAAGMLILFMIAEPVRFLPIPSDVVGPLREIIFLVVLLLFLLYKPKGLFGRAQLEG
jgi:branched-chain amino acid transport system permease protein